MTYLLILAVVAVVGGVVYFVRTQGNRGNAVGARLGRYGMAGATAGGGSSGIVGGIAPAAKPNPSAITESINRRVEGSRWGGKIAAKLERADMKMTPGEWVTIRFVIFVIACVVGLLIKPPFGLLVLGLVGFFGPPFWLRRKGKKREYEFIGQLADVAQMMGNSMRAGFSILQAMQLIGQEGNSPSKEEFERVVTEVKLGLPVDAALDHLLARQPSEDLGLMVVAINVQRQVGGNLAEILMVIAKTVRERVRFQRDLKALTAQARYSSYIITGLPIAVAIVINLMDRPYESFLYTHLLGEIMVAIALIMIGTGFFILNKIANIEV